MMHYRKGDNVEKEITKEQLPFEDCLATKDFLWMHVKGGTKLPNVISYAKKALDKGETRAVIWSGSGGGVSKTISCAEILKRSYPLYQVTRMCYQTVEEHWKAQMDGLEDIVAQRQIPCLHILMCLDAIDDSVSGLQKPNTKTDFWVLQDANHSNNSGAGGGRYGGPSRSSGNGQNQQQRQQQRPPKQRPPQQQLQQQQSQEQQKDNPASNRNQKRTRRPNKPKMQQEAAATAAPSLPTTESMET